MSDLGGLGIDHLDDVRVIGQGGFSTVYSARHVLFQRPVAVKVLNKLAKESDKRRFELECEVMGRMSDHPNVVTVYQAGYTADGNPYLIMELVTGGTLADQLAERGSIAWGDAVLLVAPICEALGLAHDEGILHRDVKPENILVAETTPKLTDFGIAYLRDSTGATSTHITASWLHTAPETFENNRDERSDLYSLASTLHQLIQGTAPFWRPDDESLSPLMMRLVSEQPPALPSELAPPALSQLLVRALAKKPDERPQSAAEFATELRAVLDGQPAGTVEPEVLAASEPVAQVFMTRPMEPLVELDFPSPTAPVAQTVVANPTPPGATPPQATPPAAASVSQFPPPVVPASETIAISPAGSAIPGRAIAVFLQRAGLAAALLLIHNLVIFGRGIEDRYAGIPIAALILGIALAVSLARRSSTRSAIGDRWVPSLFAGAVGVGAMATILQTGLNGASAPLAVSALGMGLLGIATGSTSMVGRLSDEASTTFSISSIAGFALGAIVATQIALSNGFSTAGYVAPVLLAAAAIVAIITRSIDVSTPSELLPYRVAQSDGTALAQPVATTALAFFVGGMFVNTSLVFGLFGSDDYGRAIAVAGLGIGYFGAQAANWRDLAAARPGASWLIGATAMGLAWVVYYLVGLQPAGLIVAAVLGGLAVAFGGRVPDLLDARAEGAWLWAAPIAAFMGALVSGLLVTSIDFDAVSLVGLGFSAAFALSGLIFGRSSRPKTPEMPGR